MLRGSVIFERVMMVRKGKDSLLLTRPQNNIFSEYRINWHIRPPYVARARQMPFTLYITLYRVESITYLISEWRMYASGACMRVAHLFPLFMNTVKSTLHGSTKQSPIGSKRGSNYLTLSLTPVRTL